MAAFSSTVMIVGGGEDVTLCVLVFEQGTFGKFQDASLNLLLSGRFFSTSPLACDLSSLRAIYKQNEEPNQHLQWSRRQRLRQLVSILRVQTEIKVTVKEDSGFLKEQKATEPVNDYPALSTSPGRNVIGMDLERYPRSPSPSSMTSVAFLFPEPEPQPQPSSMRNDMKFPPIGPTYKQRRRRKVLSMSTSVTALRICLLQHPPFTPLWCGLHKKKTSAFRRFGDQTQSNMVLAD